MHPKKSCLKSIVSLLLILNRTSLIYPVNELTIAQQYGLNRIIQCILWHCSLPRSRLHLPFPETYPNVNLFIDEKANKALIQELKYGNLDLAITTSPEDMENMMEIPIYIEKFVAYFSKKCQKAQQAIASGGLPAEHMWILKEGHCVPNGSLNFCKDKHTGNHIYEAGSIDTLKLIIPPYMMEERLNKYQIKLRK